MLHLCPNPARRYPTLPDERVLHDAALSLAAVGLLTKLMNAPANSSTDPQILAAHCGTGRDAIKRAVRELSAAGLLLRTTVRQPGGQLHTVTLICDDPMMLLTELTRLNTGGLVERIVPPTSTPGAGQQHRPRHARAAATSGRPQHPPVTARAGGSSPEVVGHTAGEHGEHYHHCILRTTHIYIKSHTSRGAADQHASAELTSTTQDER
jgi:hypothetical protein